MRERLRERRQRRDESEYEAHAAMGMVMLAEQRLNARENKSKAEASKQRNLVSLKPESLHLEFFFNCVFALIFRCKRGLQRERQNENNKNRA